MRSRTWIGVVGIVVLSAAASGQEKMNIDGEVDVSFGDFPEEFDTNPHVEGSGLFETTIRVVRTAPHGGTYYEYFTSDLPPFDIEWADGTEARGSLTTEFVVSVGDNVVLFPGAPVRDIIDVRVGVSYDYPKRGTTEPLLLTMSVFLAGDPTLFDSSYFPHMPSIEDFDISELSFQVPNDPGARAVYDLTSFTITPAPSGAALLAPGLLATRRRRARRARPPAPSPRPTASRRRAERPSRPGRA